MKKIILSALIATAFITSCSERYYKKGVKHYDKFEYTNAIHELEHYQSKHDKVDARVRLANSYRMVYDMPNAEKWYSTVVDLPESDPSNMFFYAKSLMVMEKYDEAKKWFNKYLQVVPDDFVAEMLLASCQSVDKLKRDTTLYTVKQANIPEMATAFAQVPYGKGIMFTGDKFNYDPSLINMEMYNWTGRSYLDIYYSAKDNSGKWLSPMLLKGNVNGQFHEGPACFTKDGKVVFFTRSNYAKKRKLDRSSKSENNLQLFRAELVDDKWTNVTGLPFNSDEYSCGHPSLSPDGKTLYFISDMPGTTGGTDIYKSVFDGTNWGKPINLGNVINTSGNEMFPYMHNDGTFYFSSDAHTNLGGLDVFMTSFDGEKWLQVENLNYPLNTSRDDFAYNLSSDGKTGYVSSNRDNYEDKIFEITKNEPTFILSGHVNQKGSDRSIDSAVVEIYNITSKTRQILLTDPNGNYKIKLGTKSEYEVKCWKPMYFTITKAQNVCTVGKKYSENMTANFILDEIIIEKPIVLDNIYYDLDKWFIRPDAAMELDRLVNVMEKNPKIHIELSSHTDSRAGDQYNMILSDKRAKAAVQYIISKGVDGKRMKWKGYGESKLVNKCKNDVPCAEEEHQQNRRTEFKVIKIMK
jgi:outer membrane protein OmpA-like peptidoglycan-associated protein/tetratricopeptide (TPR) repeat protein